MTDIFGPVLYTYTRAEAIHDGVLIDLAELKRDNRALTDRLGFKIPVAITSTAFAQVIGHPGTTDESMLASLDRGVRLLAIVKAMANTSSESTDRIYFTISNRDPNKLPVRMWAIVGPGDRGEPVLTIMLEGED